MKRTSLKKNFFSFSLLVGGLLLAGCVDNKYDLSDVDVTIGIGGDSLSLPCNNSTRAILLDDLLDLNNSDFVKIQDNGDYYFFKSCEEINPSHPYVDAFTVQKVTCSPTEIAISLPAGFGGTGTIPVDGHVEDQGVEFVFEGDVPSEVLSIKEVETASKMKLTLTFSNSLSSIVKKFTTMNLEIPSYFELSNVKSAAGVELDAKSNVFHFKNLSTATPLVVEADVIKVKDFVSNPTGENYVAFQNQQVKMKGSLKVSATFKEVTLSGGDASNLKIKTEMALDNILVNSVTGKFAIDMEMPSLGDAHFDNVPDFLTGKDVCLDIYNPQFVMNLFTDITANAFVKGKMVSYDEYGNVMVSVDVPEFPIKGNTTNNVVICRRSEGIVGFDQVVEVPNLSDLIRTIPSRISFFSTGGIDSQNDYTIDLGRAYDVVPQCEISTPLQFDKDASIVYRDTLDGWNDDLKDYRLAEDGYIKVTAKVINQMPTNLKLIAYAIDTNGNRISDKRISIEVPTPALSSANGKIPTTTNIKACIKQIDPEAFLEMDGIVIELKAYSTENGQSVTGVTLNSYTQTLTLKDIAIKVIGRVIADLN